MRDVSPEGKEAEMTERKTLRGIMLVLPLALLLVTLPVLGGCDDEEQIPTTTLPFVTDIASQVTSIVISQDRWEQTAGPPGGGVSAIAVDPADSDAIYVASEEGVFITSDRGATWSDFSDGLGCLDIRTLAISSDGVFISHDGGVHWVPWNDALTNLMAGTNGNNVTNVLALSARGDVLYFGTMGSGIWRRGLEH